MAAIPAFGDWRPVRAAIEAAYAELGLTVPSDGIPDDHWNLVVLALKYQREQSRRTCVECSNLIEAGEEIRCLDCKGFLHEACAPKHFWPNGRATPTRDLGEAMRVTDAMVDAVATAILAHRGFGFYTDPMEGGLDAYDISLEAKNEAWDAIQAFLPFVAALATTQGPAEPSQGAEEAPDPVLDPPLPILATWERPLRYLAWNAEVRVVSADAGSECCLVHLTNGFWEERVALAKFLAGALNERILTKNKARATLSQSAGGR